MSRTITPLSTEVALATTVGGASNFNNAQRLRIVNTAGSGTNHLVTVANAAGETIGSFTLGGGDMAILSKSPTDLVFAANAAVLAVPIAVKD